MNSRISEQRGFVVGSFIIGVIIGFSLCLGLSQWVDSDDQLNEIEGSEATVTGEESEDTSQPVLDFYTRLKEGDVLVPEFSEEPERRVLYYLQAGSFQEARDADGLRAQLLLLNFDAEISKFNHHGEVWHRVVVGPIEEKSTMTKAKTTLLENDIRPLVLTKTIDASL